MEDADMIEYEKAVAAMAHIDAAIEAIDDAAREDEQAEMLRDVLHDARNSINRWRVAAIGGAHHVAALLEDHSEQDRSRPHHQPHSLG